MTDTTIRVLVVDDDPTGAVLTTLALAQVSRPRFDVHTVDELTEAIKELEANDFDILLLDLGLGKYQGLEALRTVRATDKKIPIVVLAGRIILRRRLIHSTPGRRTVCPKMSSVPAA